jgi:hypothetical protein
MTKLTHFQASTVFLGTDNPRYIRTIRALLVRPMHREHVDHVAGCSNAPDLISKLRDLGLGKQGLLCTMVKGCDRDGKSIRFGVYSLSQPARIAIHSWLAKCSRGAK